MKCCFTGHRALSETERLDIMKKLDKLIPALAEKGCTEFNTGGALGFDTLAALMVMRAKQKYPQIKLNLYLPHPQQAEKWNSADIRMYEKIKSGADGIFYSSQGYTPDCMNSRNRALVDNADMCIAYCTQLRGGTAYTISYAMDNGKEVFNLAMDCYEEAVTFIDNISFE